MCVHYLITALLETINFTLTQLQHFILNCLTGSRTKWHFLGQPATQGQQPQPKTPEKSCLLWQRRQLAGNPFSQAKMFLGKNDDGTALLCLCITVLCLCSVTVPLCCACVISVHYVMFVIFWYIYIMFSVLCFFFLSTVLLRGICYKG